MNSSLAVAGDAGSPPSFAEGVALELPAVRAWLRRFWTADGDDVLQEVAARALRYRHTYDSSRPLGPWLRAVALRVVADQRAAARRRLPTTTDDAPSLEREQERIEHRETLEHALRRLSATERAVLLAFHAGGESIHEIAARTGMAPGTVKSHLHRGRQKLVNASEVP